MEGLASMVVLNETDELRLEAVMELSFKASHLVMLHESTVEDAVLDRDAGDACWLDAETAVAVAADAHPGLTLARAAALSVKNRQAASIIDRLMTSKLVTRRDRRSGSGAGGSGNKAGEYQLFRDTGSGRPYFVNAATGESSWECPIDAPIQAFSDAGAAAATTTARAQEAEKAQRDSEEKGGGADAGGPGEEKGAVQGEGSVADGSVAEVEEGTGPGDDVDDIGSAVRLL